MALSRIHQQTYPDVENHLQLDSKNPQLSFYMPDNLLRKQNELMLQIALGEREIIKLNELAYSLQLQLQSDAFSTRVLKLKEEYTRTMAQHNELSMRGIPNKELLLELERLQKEYESLLKHKSVLTNFLNSLMIKLENTIHKIQELKTQRAGILAKANEQLTAISKDEVAELVRVINSDALVTESGQVVILQSDELTQYIVEADKVSTQLIAETVSNRLQPKLVPTLKPVKHSQEPNEDESDVHLIDKMFRLIADQREHALKQAFLQKAVRHDLINTRIASYQPILSGSGKTLAFVMVNLFSELQMMDAALQGQNQRHSSLFAQLSLRQSEFKSFESKLNGMTTKLDHMAAVLGYQTQENLANSRFNTPKPTPVK